MAAILDCPLIFAPTNAPHSCGQEPQNARIPHLLGTQRAVNKVINPYQSPTYPGVGGQGFLSLVHYLGHLERKLIGDRAIIRVVISLGGRGGVARGVVVLSKHLGGSVWQGSISDQNMIFFLPISASKDLTRDPVRSNIAKWVTQQKSIYVHFYYIKKQVRSKYNT